MIEPSQHDPRDRTWVHTLERHAQSIGIALLVLGIGWAGSTLRSMYDAMIESGPMTAEIQGDMAELTVELRAIRTELARVPTQREIDARFDALGRRVEALERKKTP